MERQKRHPCELGTMKDGAVCRSKTSSLRFAVEFGVFLPKTLSKVFLQFRYHVDAGYVECFQSFKC